MDIEHVASFPACSQHGRGCEFCRVFDAVDTDDESDNEETQPAHGGVSSSRSSAEWEARCVGESSCSTVCPAPKSGRCGRRS